MCLKFHPEFIKIIMPMLFTADLKVNMLVSIPLRGQCGWMILKFPYNSGTENNSITQFSVGDQSSGATLSALCQQEDSR